MNTIKNILEENISQMGLVENLSLPYIGLVLGTALLCGLILYIVYKFFYRGAVYSENYGLLIVMSTMTVAFIIMTISSNIVLSLGMVGALSIVRFRTAVKDPLDVGFLFVAIGAGLTAGAGLFFIAIIGTVAISLVFMVMFLVGKSAMSYLLIVRCNVAAEADVADVMSTLKSKLKSKSSDGISTEFTYTVRIKKEDVVAEMLEIEGVENALLVSYTGDAQY
ncbi:MAG: DUF4956 domain-containing protein [Lachnospiraceae bacterium]|nr:DUF4956 domain-containing protein [Lachnospiraceae bacterium]